MGIFSALHDMDHLNNILILTSSDLKWSKHIKSCISKANSMIAWVTRNLIIREINVMKNVYKTIIRPHLEYCAQLWSPPACHGNWATIIELENVQRRFTRLIDDIGTLPYSERLDALQITTLAERRVRGDLIEAYKIVNGLVEYGKDIFNLSRSGDKLLALNLTILIEILKPCLIIFYQSVLSVFGINCHLLLEIQCLLLILKLI